MTGTGHAKLVIIGGGFAGAVTALKTITSAPGGLDIVIVEPSARLGRGIAYATGEGDHVVNGLAGSFALDPDRPEHFLDWLSAKVAAGLWAPPAGTPLAGSSPPRQLYGAYVEEVLTAALRDTRGRVRLEHRRDRAVDIADGAVILASGERLAAGAVVLATGLFRREPAIAACVAGHPGYVGDPFAPGSFDAVAGADRMLILGCGLTMLDAVISAERHGFRGRYTVISRSGLTVAPRREVPAWPGQAPAARTAAEVLRWIQHERRAVRAAGEDWQRLPALFRQHTRAIWAGLNGRERTRLLRRLVPFWNLAQHRAAPSSYVVFERAQKQGRLETLAGTVTRLDVRDGRLVAALRARGSGAVNELEADIVVSALGYAFDWTRIDDPLVRNLLARGLAVPHPVGLGIRGAPDSLRVIDARGRPCDWLFAIGHPFRGELWESSSIREILDQATRLGPCLARHLARHDAVPLASPPLIPA